MHKAIKKRKDTTKQKKEYCLLTDDEEEDNEETREARRDSRTELRLRMQELLSQPPTSQASTYVIDDYDDKLVREFLTGPVMRQGSMYSRQERTMDEEMRELARQGILPTGQDATNFATTAKSYKIGLRVLLGLLQV